MQVHAGHSVQHAITGRARGDVIDVHPGTYRGRLLVDKKLTIEGVGKARPVFDAKCDATTRSRSTHGGVTSSTSRSMGADEGFGDFPAEVFFIGVASGRASTCGPSTPATPNTGSRRSRPGRSRSPTTTAAASATPAIYIGTINDTLGGTLARVPATTAVHNSRGIIVEDSLAAHGHPGSQERLERQHHSPAVRARPTASSCTTHDGIDVVKNTADGNDYAGYHADANSDHNHFAGNEASDNSKDYVDDHGGRSNCGSGNSFPIPSC